MLFSLYMPPLGSILRKYDISFHCYAEDTHTYLPLKRKNASPLKLLFDCLKDIKDWMALSFLHFNESKTEIMIFGPNCTNKISNIDLGPLVPYVKSTVKNLGVIMDTDFKLDEQINSVVRSSFCRLRLLSKVKPFLSFNDFVRLIHVFISSLLDYCNALYVGVNQASLSCLQLVQNAAARLLTRTRKREHILPILSSLHWLPFRFRIDFTVLLFAYKSLNGLAPTYLSDLIQLHVPSRSLRSADHMLLTFPRVRLKHRGDRAFAVAAPKLWNSLPLSVRMAPNLSAFKTSLKTYFYSLAFNTV